VTKTLVKESPKDALYINHWKKSMISWKLWRLSIYSSFQGRIWTVTCASDWTCYCISKKWSGWTTKLNSWPCKDPLSLGLASLGSRKKMRWNIRLIMSMTMKRNRRPIGILETYLRITKDAWIVSQNTYSFSHYYLKRELNGILYCLD